MPISQADKAKIFRALHIKGQPVILYNIWDAGSARAVAQSGAKALATGSQSVAEAQGYEDGQNIPLAVVLDVAQRIVRATDLPLSVDFEGGYAEDEKGIEENVTRLLATGAIGLNFEDQVVGGEGLYAPDLQAKRIAAVRRACEKSGVPAVINARTDLFLKQRDPSKHGPLLDEAVARAELYAAAGADCFFVPLLSTPELIAKLCQRVSLPVNIMALDVTTDPTIFAQAGVARISFGPFPYIAAMQGVTQSARKYFTA